MIGQGVLAHPINRSRSGNGWASSPPTSPPGGSVSPTTPQGGQAPNPNYRYRDDRIPHGQIVGARVKDMDPQNPNPSNKRSTWIHPSVVVAGPDDKNDYKVALISNNHRDNVPTKPVGKYAPNSPVQGDISLGPPKVVNWSKLKTWKENKEGGPAPPLSDTNLAKLKNDIKTVCSDSGVDSGLQRRGLGSACSPRPRAKARGAGSAAKPGQKGPSKKPTTQGKPQTTNKAKTPANLKSRLLTKKPKAAPSAPGGPKPGAPAKGGRKPAGQSKQVGGPQKGPAPSKQNVKPGPKPATAKRPGSIIQRARAKLQAPTKQGGRPMKPQPVKKAAAANKPNVPAKANQPRKPAPAARKQPTPAQNQRKPGPKPGRK